MSERRVRVTREQRAKVQRVLNQMRTLEAREFESDSRPGKVYRTVIYVDGQVACDCRGWTTKKAGQPRWCKHCQYIVGMRAVLDKGDYCYVALPKKDAAE